MRFWPLRLRCFTNSWCIPLHPPPSGLIRPCTERELMGRESDKLRRQKLETMWQQEEEARRRLTVRRVSTGRDPHRVACVTAFQIKDVKSSIPKYNPQYFLQDKFQHTNKYILNPHPCHHRFFTPETYSRTVLMVLWLKWPHTLRVAKHSSAPSRTANVVVGPKQGLS